MREITGVGETCWHWKVRSIYRDNRFDNLAWHKGVDYRYKLASDNPRKDVHAVFVSGTLKPPCTNRGASPRKAMRFRCANCENVGVLVYEQGGLPLKPFYCHICDPRLAGR